MKIRLYGNGCIVLQNRCIVLKKSCGKASKQDSHFETAANSLMENVKKLFSPRCTLANACRI